MRRVDVGRGVMTLGLVVALAGCDPSPTSPAASAPFTQTDLLWGAVRKLWLERRSPWNTRMVLRPVAARLQGTLI